MGKVKDYVRTHRKNVIKFTVLIAVVAAMIGVTIWLMPWIISLKDEAGRQAFELYIKSKGVWGVAILLGIQVLQVVIALIPGEPVEVIAGLLYGTFGGWAICTVGMLIGTVMVYYLVKLLGLSFFQDVVDEGKLEKFKFLQDTKRLELLTFILFFIPGTPKDILTYFMPLTKIKPLTFFVIVTVARIPSVISSTFAGASIGEGKWLQTLLIFLGIGLIGIIGILLNNRLMAKENAKEDDAPEK